MAQGSDMTRTKLAIVTVLFIVACAAWWASTADEASQTLEAAPDEARAAEEEQRSPGERPMRPRPRLSDRGEARVDADQEGVEADSPEAWAGGAGTLSDPQAILQKRKLRERRLYQKLRDMEERGPFQEQMMRNLEQSSRYPRANRRFDRPEADPIATAREPRKRREPSEDGNSVMYAWTNPELPVGAPVEVYARVESVPAEGEEPEAMAAQVDASLFDDQGNAVAALAFGAPDEQGVRSATLESEGEGRLTPGQYKVRVRCELGMQQTLGLVVSAPAAHLTGDYRDRRAEGDLIVEAEVQVYQATTFHVLGSLYAGEDLAVGMAEATVSVEPGTHWLTLRFAGRLLHDAERDGPYVLRNLRVRERAYPAPAPLDESPNHMTQAYALEDFSAEPFNDLLASAEVVEGM